MEGSRPPGVSPDPLSFAAVAMDLGNDALGPPPPLPPAEAAFVSMLPTGLDQQGPWFDFPPLPQLQQTDGGLGQQLNVGLGGWAADGGGGYGRASGPAHAKEPDAATMAAKLAAAREKNRLAQQRFRERQRAKQKQAGEQCDEMQREMDQVESENAELQAQNRIYQKVLAVRDAMLQTFASLKQPESTDGPAPAPTEVAELPEPAPAAAAALAKALRELPSEVEMAAAEAAVEAVEAAVQQAEQQEQDPPSPGWTLGEAHRSGTAAQLDGSELRQVASIPAVNDTRIQATVDAMTEPEHLLDYYRQWQAELSVAYVAAEAAGFDAAGIAELTALQGRMAKVWWHASQRSPAYVCFLAHAALPEDSAQCPLWRDIATAVLPQLLEQKRAILRRAWYNYSRNLAKIAVGVGKWVRRLQEYVVQPPSGLVTNAQRALELAEITRHMARAVQDEYVASMQFIGEQAAATTEAQKALINHRSQPFMPDLVAIVYHMLCMDAAEQSHGKSGSPSGLQPPPTGDALLGLMAPPDDA